MELLFYKGPMSNSKFKDNDLKVKTFKLKYKKFRQR